ncbi:MAG TPA: carboxymuconolactone decarboxylase family protein [Blastocatellia bacterium]|nr:carboxymuconolactone decarboxylase family protein [Blastocatellia bacterium]HMV82544.1 carboxymuconolactone decarboxylase family protein [Blastocatellia bacterium]HMY71886.1 carboxymuconolactone decarboxylase family protein [Blastocatellia bacterium]HNG34451.1 carboxymuconolactone decarboxylase family protein [Blastocatellia bacterium]
MHLSNPRLKPLTDEQLDDDARRILDRARMSGRVLNIFRTLARHPKLLERWMVFGTHILNKSTLPPRERELAILRIGWLCRSEYEWGQHVLIGRQAGLTDEEIARVKTGADAAGWSKSETALLRAVDELHAEAFISDATWQSLSARFSTQQLLDLIFTVGQYNLVAMALNTLGVQLDEGVPGFDG